VSAGGITVQQAIDRAHRILDRMGIPGDATFSIVVRLKTVRMYMNAIRGKWLREKKKAVAANRALEEFRRGDTKSWKRNAEEARGEINRAIEIFRTKHKAQTWSAGGSQSYITNIVEYLVDRSNQLFANDSAAEKRAISDVKMARAEEQAARLAKHNAEKSVAALQRRLWWYEQRFGYYSDEVADITPAFAPESAMRSLMAEADSFPWKRGNLGYLGDYSVPELLHEVEMRYKGMELSRNAAQRAYTEYAKGADDAKA
jgi:hypothetical protein